MFHPYVAGSNSPFGPSPSGSPSRSTPPIFRAPPPNPSRTRDGADDDSDSDSDRNSFDSSEGSVYCARPAKSRSGSERSSYSRKGKEVDYGDGAEGVAGEEEDKRKPPSRETSGRGGWYSDEEDDADSNDGYYYHRHRNYATNRGVYDYYEYASPTEPLFPPTPPPAPPEFPFPHTTTPPLSTSPLVSSLFPVGHPPGGSSIFNRPIFRPPTSMNRSYGTINAHPFHRAPMAERSFRERAGEETPEELEGDEESGWGDHWGSERRGRRRERREGAGVWRGLLSGCCLVCCCVRVEDMD